MALILNFSDMFLNILKGDARILKFCSVLILLAKSQNKKWYKNKKKSTVLAKFYSFFANKIKTKYIF